MTKQKMIDVIYKRIANKELSFGCKIKYIVELEPPIGVYISNGKIYWNDIDRQSTEKKEDYEIIGHPVMIGDVIDYIEKELSVKNKLPYVIDILKFWTDKRKPIEEQSEKCISYIYNLIK